MVTRYGRELVLIDFGRSKRITKADRFAVSNLGVVDYEKDETVETMYQYGTLGYAAPECFAAASDGSTFPFTQCFESGKCPLKATYFHLERLSGNA